jgi:proline dehydrogenase
MFDALLRALFVWLSHRRWLARLAIHTPWVRRVARRFVAGTTLDEAVAAVRAVNAAGMSATLDHLGEAVTDRATAERAAAAYVETIERIAAAGLDANVSLKLTQMGLDLGPEVCCEMMRPLVEAGRRHGIFVRVDMESSDYTDRTLEVVRSLRASGYEVGAVVQAYLHRSATDVAALAATKIRVRVCKGAYAEPTAIAWHDRHAIGRSFIELCETLLEADGYPAIATHDPEMIDALVEFATEHSIPRDRFEFQMLYGIRRDLQARLAKDGYRVRVYVPYGAEWWPYFLRRLAERPANVMFLVRSVLGERRPAEG